MSVGPFPWVWSRERLAKDKTVTTLEVCGPEKDMSSIYSRSKHSWRLLLLPGCQRSQNQQASREKREHPCISTKILSPHQKKKKSNSCFSFLCSAGTEDSCTPKVSYPGTTLIAGNDANRALSYCNKHHPFGSLFLFFNA